MTAPRDVAATLARPRLAPILDGRFDKSARPTSGSAEARSRTRPIHERRTNVRILAMSSGLVLVRRVRAALMSQGEFVHAIGEGYILRKVLDETERDEPDPHTGLVGK